MERKEITEALDQWARQTIENAKTNGGYSMLTAEQAQALAVIAIMKERE